MKGGNWKKRGWETGNGIGTGTGMGWEQVQEWDGNRYRNGKPEMGATQC